MGLNVAGILSWCLSSIQHKDITLQPNAVIEYIQAVLVSSLALESRWQVFYGIPLCLQASGQYLIFGTYFLTYPFQFIIHHSSYHFDAMYLVWATDNIIKP